MAVHLHDGMGYRDALGDSPMQKEGQKTMRTCIKLGKAGTLVFWGLVAFTMVRPLGPPLGQLLIMAAPLIMGIHVMEAFFFIRTFKEKVPELSAHALQVLIFGVFHILEVREDLAPKAVRD
ncbi:MAG: DUF1145 domain-containing protein [Myxococcota bacterium]|nr:DUF1145 domain-containing protein [Myxococcota bacterium]